MAFPIAWAVGSFVGGLLAKEFYDDVIADNYEDDKEEKDYYWYEVVFAELHKKLINAGDAKGLYDFGCILETGDKGWARIFIKAAADMDFMLAQQKLRCMDAED